MKKILLTVFFTVACVINQAHADEYGKFYEDVMISADVKLEENAESAKNKAGSLLDAKIPVIKIEGLPAPSSTKRGEHRRLERNGDESATVIDFNRASQPIVVDNTITKYGEGPFGLAWGGTYNQTKALGVDLEKVTTKDYANSFKATKLPSTLPDIDKVIVSFGDDNLLWRILAYGQKLDDDSEASKVLKVYRRYYKLLNQKYGNGKEFFTPKITVIEKKVKDENDREKIEVTRIEEPIGNPDFLSQLQKGEASLYATFENAKVGAALAVYVDGNSQSYIIIDFTNLQIYKEREEQTLNAL
ncbi:MAG: hypothetical protein IJ689_01780 [Alphaproteobacteria bacterium]|nr:hypothetical protein [Alphaproteobacteria bacterium]